MRLHRLELEGFGPFRERQTVDFDAFADDGIFLIAGRTGAGKSSVLDGVCFALYGSVPRYEGTDRRLRSDHCALEDPTSVSLEFSTGGRRLLLTRSPEYERPKRRGIGMAKEPHGAELFEWVDGRWIGRAARAVDVGHEIDELLGLSKQQFLQVILLAQNRFAEFLLAGSDDRQKLLRRLFGTRTYEGYQTALDDRRKTAEQTLNAAGNAVAMLLAEAERILAQHDLLGTAGGPLAESDGREAPDALSGLPVRLEAARTGLQRADYRAETFARERDAAATAHLQAEAADAEARRLREGQDRRAASRAALAELEGREPSIAERRLLLAHAIAAEALRAPIDAARRADDTLARRLADERSAREAWTELEPDGEWDADALRGAIAQLTGDVAVWAVAASRERELVELDAALAREIAAADADAHAVGRLDAAREGHPAALARLDAQLSPARDLAANLTARETALEAVTLRLAAARKAVSLSEAFHRAEIARLAAIADHDVARATVTDLLRRRLAGHAAELAARLVDGEPCAVCGATGHPAPAQPFDEPITDEMLADAERLRDAAAARETAAAETAVAAREAHAALAAKAGGESPEDLASALVEAERALREARDAAGLRDSLTADKDRLIDADRVAASERERLAAALAEKREAIAARSAEADAARRIVAEARGDFRSVAERIAAATDRRRRAGALADSLQATEAARRAAADARSDRDARVAASVFAADDADAAAAAAESALLDPRAREALDAEIRGHEQALHAERDRLRGLELELAGIPDEPVDIQVTATALAGARDAWHSAVEAALRAEQATGSLRDLLDRAEAERSETAALAAAAAAVTRLAHTVAGRPPNTHRMTLEAFVLAAELEEIVTAANLRLSAMSSGRYLIQHTDARAARNAASGLGLEILDAYTGHARPAQSLSGGETFLASLALALGLAEVVTARAGGIRLDTLFIDEGFGSLDGDTLDLAMRTLDELRQGGRTVGVISHVDVMKEQLAAQLIVEATPRGPSIIRQDVRAEAASIVQAPAPV